MIAKKDIIRNIRFINTKYGKSISQKELLLLSKLAVLELCGWIEEAMDDIILRQSLRCLKEPDNQKSMKDTVKKNYGFEYNPHFRNMLIRLIGLVNIEQLEKNIDQAKKAKLEAVLISLKEARNALAHTHIKGVTHTVNAPSITLSQFGDVYDGLTEIDKYLKSNKF